jgi:hypothetical protein
MHNAAHFVSKMVNFDHLLKSLPLDTDNTRAVPMDDNAEPSPVIA